MRVLALDLGSGWRGGQKQSAALVRGLAGRGHEVLLVVRKGSALLREISGGAPGRLETVAVGGHGEAAPGALFAVARAARRFAPDVLYAGDAHGHGASVFSGAATGRRLVVHRRVAFPLRGNPFSRLKCRAVDRWLAISRAVAATLVRGGIDPGRVTVIPDGLPLESYVCRPVPPGPPWRLIHVGAFDGKKGQQTVVEVLSRLVRRGLDTEAVFLGDGPLREEVEETARRAGVAGRCIFAGDVRDVPDRLAASHLLLLPSESEGASLALAEAMAAGCVCLAHDTGGVREVLAEGKGGRLLTSLDADSWADAAAELLADEATRRRLIDGGRRLAAGRTMERALERVEEELAAR